MGERFNALPGMSCQPAEGAMYLFPSIDMPKRAVEEAEKSDKSPDTMYALDLLGMFIVSPKLNRLIMCLQMRPGFVRWRDQDSVKSLELIISVLRRCVREWRSTWGRLRSFTRTSWRSGHEWAQTGCFDTLHYTLDAVLRTYESDARIIPGMKS